MQDNIQTMRQATATFRSPISLADPLIWFVIGFCIVVLAPIVSVAPWLQTFIHPWRAELAAALLTGAFLIWACRNDAFRSWVPKISKLEIFAIIIPCSIFTIWSFFSAAYAGAWPSVLHHSGIWAVYVAFYVIARFLVEKRSNIEMLLVPIAAIVWMIGLPAVFEYYSSVTFGEASTIGIRYSKYAEMLNVLFPLVFAYTLKLRGRSFWLGVATILLVWLFDISSVSRTAIGLYLLGTIMIAAPVFGLRRFRHYRKKFLVLLLVLFVTPVLLHLPSAFSNGVPVVNRINDETTAQSNNVRPFFAKIALEMFRAHPLTGVGADNFGREFNKYRAVYTAQNPDGPGLAIAEAEIPERAHNEFVQIGAELGIPGLVFIAWFLAGIAALFFVALKRFRRISLSTICAFIGLALFLASSLVSSYSFRLVQNGLVFFIVLAIAARGTVLRKRKRPETINPWMGRFAFSAAVLCCVMLAILSVTRAAAVVYVYRAASAETVDEAGPSFETSFALDDQNASAWSVYGMYLFNSGKYNEAATKFRRSVDLGRATTADYSYLASAQFLGGDGQAAGASLAESLGIYPRSVFMRSRYGVLLDEEGRHAEAQEQFSIASKIDASQAETWRNLIADGPVVASRRSFDGNLLPVMDLKPENGIYAVVAEREIRHPEEKANFHP